MNTLLERLDLLCDDIARIGGRGVDPVVAQVRADLAAPQPRIAVVGRVKAGKSTLVNALLGRRAAPTSEAECTRVVTHYRWGAPERAEVHRLDGSVRTVPLDAGRLPDDLGVPLEEVSHAVVHLQQAALRDMVLVDTPGLATTTTANETATRRAVLEAGQADALVYVFRDTQRADDVGFLRDYGAVTGRAVTDAHAGDSIGVLSHADTFGEGPWGAADPFEVARAYAATVAEGRRQELGTVVPVSGRLAETARTGLVTEALTRRLASFADVTDALLRFPDDGTAPVVDELAGVVGDYGLRHGRVVAREGSTALQSWVLARSNHEELEHALRARYLGRHVELRGRSALERLRRAANGAGAPHALALLRAISEAELDPALHRLAELRAWEDVRAAHPGHPVAAALEAQLGSRSDARRVGLAGGAEPAEVRDRALTLAVGARRDAALAPDRVLGDAHRVLVRSYELVAERSTL